MIKVYLYKCDNTLKLTLLECNLAPFQGKTHTQSEYLNTI